MPATAPTCRRLVACGRSRRRFDRLIGLVADQLRDLNQIAAFVGGMVGLERTVVPLIGTEEFGIGSEVVIFSFIITFGLSKPASISYPAGSPIGSRGRRC